ncbi:TIGR03621 family F420-dependent LLM class oxidoreductase [Nocardia nova]|uniref:TIGR03621 family F420-dependent LLM class oxidoreductase n=1 Tax=Nocardia nova TaxID=37330 RepID=UPI0018953BEA|nr:TIGR03621 family F420-dependent LLM class oxidoreductase [Nocardia nova]MBF6146409.1 TIGR03621 family F420-dependent LLM class oxidoreductase [Nocardia nova]MDN2501678.1 TIGR03621 family F420-dependent LLM class oxidoreductase [Nocardia nova]
MTRAFRFGISIMAAPADREWIAAGVRAESQGYDIVLVPDHLTTPAPFPFAVAATHATRLRVGTYVLNAGLYPTALLTREITTVTGHTAGRFELGIGTGYLPQEFTAVGVDPGSPRDRVDDLARAVDAARTALGARTDVPILVAGNGNRVLRLAARHADIVSFLGMRYAPSSAGGLIPLGQRAFAERVAYFDRVAADRTGSIERNLTLRAVVVTDDRDAALRALTRRFRLPAEVLSDLPILLVGTIPEIAKQVQDLRERFGISYFAVPDRHQDEFAPVVELLRGA